MKAVRVRILKPNLSFKMRTLTAFIVGLLIGVLICNSASAGSLTQGTVVCAERGDVVTQLEQRYGEEPVFMGLASIGAVIEILASPTGTFTIILTRPNGLSCLMAAGDAWEDVPPKLKGPKT